jgi:tetratricopeptide (TPR) repeat protein
MKYFLALILYLSSSFITAKAAKGYKPSQASIATFIETASEQYKAENYDGAILNYKKAFEKDSTNPRIHFGLGASYIAIKKYDLAIEHLLRALELNPALVEAYFSLAYAYQAYGKNTEALIAYRQGLGLDLGKPLPKSSFFNEVILSANEEATQDNDFKIISANTEENTSSLNIKEEKQIIDISSSSPNEEIEEYTRELVNNPSDVQVQYKLALAYIKAKKFEEAKKIQQSLSEHNEELSNSLKEKIENAKKE